MQSGELIVTGENSITIPLSGFPVEVHAKFKDCGPEAVPCDPGNVDFLSCDVHTSNTHHSGFVLVISWSVSSVREIVWHAGY
jgi:hypothetical protein